MHFSKLVCPLVFIAAISVAAHAQSFRQAHSDKPPESTANRFHIKVAGVLYSIYGDSGRIRIADKHSKKFLKVPLGKDGWIEGVKFLRYKNALIVLYENNYGGYSDSRIASIDIAKKQIVWTRQIPTFNTAGTASLNFIYLAGIGYFSKLNLNSGKFAWKHQRLYVDKFGKIDAPDNPVVRKNSVEFLENKEIAASYSRKPRRIFFDRSSGKITAIRLN